MRFRSALLLLIATTAITAIGASAQTLTDLEIHLAALPGQPQTLQEQQIKWIADHALLLSRVEDRRRIAQVFVTDHNQFSAAREYVSTVFQTDSGFRSWLVQSMKNRGNLGVSARAVFRDVTIYLTNLLELSAQDCIDILQLQLDRGETIDPAIAQHLFFQDLESIPAAERLRLSQTLPLNAANIWILKTTEGANRLAAELNAGVPIFTTFSNLAFLSDSDAATGRPLVTFTPTLHAAIERQLVDGTTGLTHSKLHELVIPYLSHESHPENRVRVLNAILAHLSSESERQILLRNLFIADLPPDILREIIAGIDGPEYLRDSKYSTVSGLPARMLMRYLTYGPQSPPFRWVELGLPNVDPEYGDALFALATSGNADVASALTAHFRTVLENFHSRSWDSSTVAFDFGLVGAGGRLELGTDPPQVRNARGARLPPALEASLRATARYQVQHSRNAGLEATHPNHFERLVAREYSRLAESAQLPNRNESASDLQTRWRTVLARWLTLPRVRVVRRRANSHGPYELLTADHLRRASLLPLEAGKNPHILIEGQRFELNAARAASRWSHEAILWFGSAPEDFGRNIHSMRGVSKASELFDDWLKNWARAVSIESALPSDRALISRLETLRTRARLQATVTSMEAVSARVIAANCATDLSTPIPQNGSAPRGGSLGDRARGVWNSLRVTQSQDTQPPSLPSNNVPRIIASPQNAPVRYRVTASRAIPYLMKTSLPNAANSPSSNPTSLERRGTRTAQVETQIPLSVQDHWVGIDRPLERGWWYRVSDLRITLRSGRVLRPNEYVFFDEPASHSDPPRLLLRLTDGSIDAVAIRATFSASPDRSTEQVFALNSQQLTASASELRAVGLTRLSEAVQQVATSPLANTATLRMAMTPPALKYIEDTAELIGEDALDPIADIARLAPQNRFLPLAPFRGRDGRFLSQCTGAELAYRLLVSSAAPAGLHAMSVVVEVVEDGIVRGAGHRVTGLWDEHAAHASGFQFEDIEFGEPAHDSIRLSLGRPRTIGERVHAAPLGVREWIADLRGRWQQFESRAGRRVLPITPLPMFQIPESILEYLDDESLPEVTAAVQSPLELIGLPTPIQNIFKAQKALTAEYLMLRQARHQQMTHGEWVAYRETVQKTNILLRQWIYLSGAPWLWEQVSQEIRADTRLRGVFSRDHRDAWPTSIEEFRTRVIAWTALRRSASPELASSPALHHVWAELENALITDCVAKAIQIRTP